MNFFSRMIFFLFREMKYLLQKWMFFVEDEFFLQNELFLKEI